MKVIFSHGKDGSPTGRTIQSLFPIAEKYTDDISCIDYRDLPNPDDRARRLEEKLQEVQAPVILVGSSLGGYVSLAAAAAQLEKVAGLFLMAPVLFLPGSSVNQFEIDSPRIDIVHGWNDEIVPYELSVRFASRTQSRLLLVEAGHRLSVDALDTILVEFDRFLQEMFSRTSQG